MSHSCEVQILIQSTFDYVGIGIRFVAQLIDTFIVSLLVGLVMSAAGYDVSTPALGFNPLTLVMIGAIFVYFVLTEGFLGATVGKMVFRVKVLKEDGSPCGLGPAVVRIHVFTFA